MGLFDIFKPRHRGYADVEARVIEREMLLREFERRLLVWWLDGQEKGPRLWVDITDIQVKTQTGADGLYLGLKDLTRGRNDRLAEYIHANCLNVSIYHNEHTGHVFITPYYVTEKERTVTRSVVFDDKHLEIRYLHNGLDGTYQGKIDLRNGVALRALRYIQKHDDKSQGTPNSKVALYVVDNEDETNSIKIPDVLVQWDIPDTTEVEKYVDKIRFTVTSVDIKTTEWAVGGMIDERLTKYCTSTQPMSTRVDGDTRAIIRLEVDKQQQEQAIAKKAIVDTFLQQEETYE